MRLALALPVVLAASAALPADHARAGPRGRSCVQQGSGFVEVPSTSTCIRISGRVRSEYGLPARGVARGDVAGFRAGGRLAVDSRTDTAYGPLRTYVRLKAGQGSTPGP